MVGSEDKTTNLTDRERTQTCVILVIVGQCTLINFFSLVLQYRTDKN